MAKREPLMPNPYQPDEETLGETLRNLGVPVERQDKGLTGVKWTSPPYIQKATNLIRLTEKGVYITNDMAMDLHWRVMFGSGKYQGQKVILVKHDPKGYKPCNRTITRPGIVSKKVIKDLLAAGLKPGLYEPVKIKGGWMGVPTDGR